MASRYLRNLGLEAMGMTGSFHRSWGDFGTVRNQAALDYECFSMLAQANQCAIGDHLHPRGRLEKAVYELGYEMNNRPDWIWIPVQGIRSILEGTA